MRLPVARAGRDDPAREPHLPALDGSRRRGGRRPAAAAGLLAPGSKIYHATHWGPLLELEGEVREVPADLLRADGGRLPVLVNAVLRRTASGEPAGIRASVFDATDRRRYERELVAARDVERTAREELEARAEQQAAVVRLGARALEGVALPVLIAEATAAVRATIGAERVEVLPTTSEASGGETLSAVIGTPAAPFGHLVARGAGASRGAADFGGAVAHVLGGAIARRRSDAQTQHQATHDPLTGLPNRLLLAERLEEQVARGRRHGSRFGLCLLDLDHFKLVNDTLGHVGGDELLRGVAERLRSAVRAEDMVVRLGGDEFVVLCGEIDSDCDAEVLAGRITGALAAPFAIGGAEHAVGASIGVVLGDGGSAAQDVLRDADVAMYQAKARGRGQHARFDQSMLEQASERVRVEAELRVALRRGELRVHYQPVVAAATERIASMEALVRWEHPERGLLAPGAFIPVAEECGLVVDLGRFVLHAACAQLAQWRADGLLAPGTAVAVNVSGRQLAQAEFPAEVARALAESGLEDEPGRLHLEVTETVLMESSASPATVLAELAALGVELSLDDFGTGASSLARLKRFPVDTLKIDRAFVAGLGEGDGEDDAIVAAVMGMAAALGLGVVAEGVETRGQLERLRDLGCERIQGYLFSRPVPAPAMAEMLRRDLAAG